MTRTQKQAVLTRVLVEQPNPNVVPVEFLTMYPGWRFQWPERPTVFVAQRRGAEVAVGQVALRELGDVAEVPEPRWRSHANEAKAVNSVENACAAKLRAGYHEAVWNTRRDSAWFPQNPALVPASVIAPDLIRALADTKAYELANAPPALTRILARESNARGGRPARVLIVRCRDNALDIEDVTLRTPMELATFQRPKKRLFADAAAAEAEMDRLCGDRLRKRFFEFVYDKQEKRAVCPANPDMWPRPLFIEELDDALMLTARRRRPKIARPSDDRASVADLVFGRATDVVRDRHASTLLLPSGRLVVTDPYHACDKPLGARVPPGAYTVLVSRLVGGAALTATVVIEKAEPTSWRHVSDVSVDVARVALCSVEVARELVKETIPVYDRLNKVFSKLSLGARGTLVSICTDSDGSYPVYYGMRDRKLVCVTVCFDDSIAD